MPTYTINGKRIKTDSALSEDQIDEIAADLTLTTAPTTAPAIAAAPEQPKRTLPGAVFEAATNLPSSYGKAIGGLYEAVLHPLDTAGGLVKGVTNVAEGAARRVLPASVNNWLTQIESASPAESDRFAASPEGQAGTKAAAESAGNYVTQKFGSKQGFLNALATDPVGLALDVSTVLGLGGATRLARATNPFAALSSPFVTKPVTAAARLVGKPVAALMIRPKANTLLEAAGGKGPEIVNALRGNTEIVPGSMPTAGQAAAGVGATRYSALQKAAAEGDALNAEYFARMQQQEAARLAAIRGVGKTEAELEGAQAVRKGTAAQNYGQAERQVVQADPELTALMDTPAIKAALGQAKKIALNKQDVFDIGETAPAGIQSVPANVPGWPGAVSKVATPATFAEYPVKSLHYVKMALDDMTRDPERFGIGSAEAGAIKNVRGKFMTWLEDKAPDYATARKTFATQSAPINQMEVGQYLESKLTGALDETGQQRATAFGGAVKNAAGTIKQATTGGSKFEKLSEVLTPDQLRAVDEVRRDLTRQGLFEREAKFASGAGPNAGDAATRMSRELAGGTALPTRLNLLSVIVNAITKRLAGKIDRKVAIEIATEMLDPKKAAAAMEIALAKQAKVAKLKSIVRNVGKAAKSQVAKDIARAAVVSENALAPQESNNAMAQ